MDAERFERLIEAYGGAPARWPDAERADALAYRDGSPEAASLCAAAFLAGMGRLTFFTCLVLKGHQ